MKKFIYSLVASLMFSFSIQAQNVYPEQLEMDASQKEKFEMIEKSRKESMMSIDGLRKTNSDSYTKQRDRIMYDSDMKIKAILNEQQWSIYERIIKQRDELLRKIR